MRREMLPLATCFLYGDHRSPVFAEAKVCTVGAIHESPVFAEIKRRGILPPLCKGRWIAEQDGGIVTRLRIVPRGKGEQRRDRALLSAFPALQFGVPILPSGKGEST